MRMITATAFAVFNLLIAGSALAQTPDDNPVINAYRQQGGGGTPTDNFMYNGNQQYGPGTPTDNFVQHMMSPHQDSGYGQNGDPNASPDSDPVYQQPRGNWNDDDQ